MNDAQPLSRAASPCIGVCVIDPASGLCAGCARTLDEIAVWGMLGEKERAAILASLAARKQACGVIK